MNEYRVARFFMEHGVYRPTAVIYTVSKKYATWRLLITFAKNYFTGLFIRKFSVYTLQRVPPRLEYVAIFVKVENLNNVTDFDSILYKLLTCSLI